MKPRRFSLDSCSCLDGVGRRDRVRLGGAGEAGEEARVLDELEKYSGGLVGGDGAVFGQGVGQSAEFLDIVVGDDLELARVGEAFQRLDDMDAGGGEEDVLEVVVAGGEITGDVIPGDFDHVGSDSAEARFSAGERVVALVLGAVVVNGLAREELVEVAADRFRVGAGEQLGGQRDDIAVLEQEVLERDGVGEAVLPASISKVVMWRWPSGAEATGLELALGVLVWVSTGVAGMPAPEAVGLVGTRVSLGSWTFMFYLLSVRMAQVLSQIMLRMTLVFVVWEFGFGFW